MKNQLILVGRIGHLYKLPYEEIYKTRLTTEKGQHRIHIPKQLINRKLDEYFLKIVAIIGHIDQTLFDTEHIRVDQIAIFDEESSNI